MVLAFLHLICNLHKKDKFLAFCNSHVKATETRWQYTYIYHLYELYICIISYIIYVHIHIQFSSVGFGIKELPCHNWTPCARFIPALIWWTMRTGIFGILGGENEASRMSQPWFCSDWCIKSLGRIIDDKRWNLYQGVIGRVSSNSKNCVISRYFIMIIVLFTCHLLYRKQWDGSSWFEINIEIQEV